VATRGPIFVIGSAGSGVGLLRLAIDAHEQIAVAPETGFMRAERAHEFIPFWPFGARWHRRLGLSEEELDAHLRSLYDGLFRGYAERAGKQRWGEATPWHLWHVEAIARLFPDAVFAAMVRHPGATVISGVRRRDLTFGAAARIYAEENAELVRQAARSGDRFALVRFEDLVLDPEATARALFEWLGEPWPERGLVGTEDLDPERVSRWTRSVGEGRRGRLAKRVGALCELFGYDLGEPRPVDKWPGLLLGSEVEDRLGRLPGFDRTAPPVPLADRLLDPRELELRPVPPAPTVTAPPLPPRPSPLRRAARPVVRRLPRGMRRRLRGVLHRG
jgi:hypothetical protein